MGVSEDYQRKAIMLSIDQLRGRQTLEVSREAAAVNRTDSAAFRLLL